MKYFSRSTEYNLIFAPHAFLAERSMFINLFLGRFNKFDNIHIDLGSESLNNMTYLTVSDCYIGDVSSQILELIKIKPRPCIMLDAHNLSRTNEFVTFRLGNVVKSFSDFESNVISLNIDFDNKYKSIQEKIGEEMFYEEAKSASSMAAEAVLRL